MPTNPSASALVLPRPTQLLTQNREMRAIGVWNWTLPAWAGRFPDGQTYNTCPSAGICRLVCYARHGTYTWPTVKAKHQANLRFVLDDLPGWQQAMIAELQKRRFHGIWVRIHDSGDFFNDRYLRAWLSIMRARPDTNFYAYTKEVGRFRSLVEPHPPDNFLWVYSFGGRQDSRLDIGRDRVADVFPDEASIAAAGWHAGGQRPPGRPWPAPGRNPGQPNPALPQTTGRSHLPLVASRGRRRAAQPTPVALPRPCCLT